MSLSTPSRLARLSRVALPAAPLALAAIPEAKAVIVYTNPADTTITAGGSNKLWLDLGTGGGTGSVQTSAFNARDLKLAIYTAANPYVRGASFSDGATASTSTLTEASSYRLSFLSAGVTIDSGAFSLTNPSAYIHNGGGNSQWTTGTTGYFGVKFNGGSGTNYGWVQLSYNNDGSVTVIDFAYESTGAAILTGDTGSAIPEPSTTPVVVGLTALIAGSAALYRRRKSAPASPAIAR